MSKISFKHVDEEIRQLDEIIKDKARKIKELELYTQSAPDIIAKQKNIILPLEAASRKRQETKIHVNLANSKQVYNIKRELTSNAVLLFLLLLAITASSIWILKILNQV